MKKVIFLIELILASLLLLLSHQNFLKAQTRAIDSLKEVLETPKEDSNKINILNKLGYELWEMGEFKQSLDYANRQLRLVEKLGYKKKLSNAYNRIGAANLSLGNNDEALNYFGKELKTSTELGDSENMSIALRNIANTYTYQGYLDSALIYNFKSLAIFKGSEDKSQIARCYSNIGTIYGAQQNFVAGLEYDLRALRLFEELGDQKRVATAYLSIGTIYRDRDNFQEGLNYYFKGLEICQNIDDKVKSAKFLINIATIYFDQSNYQEALEYYLKGLRMQEELGDKSMVAASSHDIGDLYREQGNYSEALKYFAKSLKLSKEIGNKTVIIRNYFSLGNLFYAQGRFPEALDSINTGLAMAKEIGGEKGSIAGAYYTLSDIYFKMHNLDSTYHYFKLYSEMRDSILNEENSRQLNEMQAKYETEKKDKEITQLNLENEKRQSQLALLTRQHQISELNLITEQQQKELITSENERNKQSLLLAGNIRKQQQDSISNLSVQKTLITQLAYSEHNKRNWSTGGGIGIAALLSLVFYQLNRRRRTKHSLQINQLNNKVLRSQLNPHFIFNALNSIKSYIQQHPEIAGSYLTKFSLLMRQVLENSEEEKISLQEEIAMLENYMQLESILVPHGFDYDVSVDESTDAANTMVPPLIFQPMVENAIIHGLRPLNKRGKINLRFTETNGLLQAIIEDNGIGEFSAVVSASSGNKKRSMGMQITRERIELINRKSQVKGWLKQQLFEHGSNVKIAIPLQ